MLCLGTIYFCCDKEIVRATKLYMWLQFEGKYIIYYDLIISVISIVILYICREMLGNTEKLILFCIEVNNIVQQCTEKFSAVL